MIEFVFFTVYRIVILLHALEHDVPVWTLFCLGQSQWLKTYKTMVWLWFDRNIQQKNNLAPKH
jgi:hypothetical protein